MIGGDSGVVLGIVKVGRLVGTNLDGRMVGWLLRLDLCKLF